MNNEHWTEKTIEKMLYATIKEQRSKRRWGIFFKLLIMGYLIALLLMFMPSGSKKISQTVEHTAVINIDTEIGANSPSSAENINKSLTNAFENPNARAIILSLNSPGGSPVQSGVIYDEILRLRKQYPYKPVYAVVSDICASGCYYIAVAADEIYVNEASLIGSIGVMFNGFGLVGLSEKIGLQRRLVTAGSNKDFLDPFRPVKPEQEAFLQNMLNIIHEQFIDKVKARRGDKLDTNPDIFSGLVWTGQQALPLGLADAYGSVDYVAREIIGETTMIDYTYQESFFGGLAKGFGASLNHAIQSFNSNPVMLK